MPAKSSGQGSAVNGGELLCAVSRDGTPGLDLFPFWEHATVRRVRVSNRSTVRAFAAGHADAGQALFAWFAEVEQARWSGPADIKGAYPAASFLAGNRVVFNIKGNRYRVVVAVKYDFHSLYIRFIGTHAAYDEIDAATI